MTWRKWLVRCLVFTIASGIGAAALLYQQWTNPAAVRQQVIEHLGAYFPGAHVSLDSAHLKLLGGISLRELRLNRRGDPEAGDFLHVPEATIHPDKEQVARGRFAVRKIELHRATLRLRRDRQGKWNLSELLAAPNLSEYVPTIEFRGGTIRLEDELACPHLPVVEFTDVVLTLINDPLPTIRIQVRGSTRLAEILETQATLERETNDLTIFVKATGVAVDSGLVDRLGSYAPELADHAQHLTGRANLEARLAYHAALSQPWTHDVRWQLSACSLRHPKVPIPLEDLAAEVRCVDGHVSVDRLTARHGTAKIQFSAKAHAPREDADVRGDLRVEHLPITSDIFAELPAGLQRMNKDFAPVGPVTLDLHFERTAGNWLKRCTVRPEDVTATFQKFPYPLEHITGALVQEIDESQQREVLTIDLVGFAGGQRVYVKGHVHGVAPELSADVKVWGDDITLDQKLQNALSPKHQKIALAFHPTGKANFEAHVRREPSSPEWLTRYLIRFHHTTVKYDHFPYPLEDVSGVLDIRPHQWEGYGFRGTHHGGVFHASARFQPTSRGDLLTVHVRGNHVALDEDLKDALIERELKQAWKTVRPGGHMDFTAQVVRQADQPPDVQVDITATQSTMRPEFFDCQLEDVTGNLRYAHRWVRLENLRARHGKSIIHLDQGRIFLNPEGGVWAEIPSLRGEPLVPEPDLLRALPPVLTRACEAMQLRDPVQLKTKLVVATEPGQNNNPDIYWEGTVALKGATLLCGVPVERIHGEAACTGRYTNRRLEGVVGNLALKEATVFNQPFRDVHSQIQVARETPDVLALPGLRASIHGGEMHGPIRIEFGSRVRYELDLTASRINLEEFGRHNLGSEAKLSGLATAHLHLEGKGPDLRELRGRGMVDVPQGRLGPPLPLLLELLKFLSIRLPDGVAFEEAHASFTLNGPRVNVERVDLFGNSISLRGKGEMNYDGSDVNMEFYAVWARVTQLLPPIIKEIPHDLSKHLLKIHARGRIGDVHFTKEPVPIVVEPLMGLLDRMAGRNKNKP